LPVQFICRHEICGKTYIDGSSMLCVVLACAKSRATSVSNLPSLNRYGSAKVRAGSQFRGVWRLANHLSTNPYIQSQILPPKSICITPFINWGNTNGTRYAFPCWADIQIHANVARFQLRTLTIRSQLFIPVDVRLLAISFRSDPRGWSTFQSRLSLACSDS
jgi:hypothetical protein